ncbi:MAG: 4'-phosphopantetheinyl transferase superfamily protein [Eubacterium sp.]|nr:4'-phosphopantetheinyl transferase superfamily protein [Eubacterium sp.]
MENKVFILNTDVLLNRSVFDRYYAKQRPERRDRVDRMRFEKGKRLCLGAGIVMEHALAHAGCSDREIVITKAGKPTVEGCFFNASDTGNIAVCAVSDRCVGIDVEASRHLDDGLIKKAFTPAEIEMVGKGITDFIRLWTIKESVMKWYGLGLGLMPENIDISMDDGIRVRIFGHPELDTSSCELCFTFFQEEDYRITVCSEDSVFADGLIWLDEEVKNGKG